MPPTSSVSVLLKKISGIAVLLISIWVVPGLHAIVHETDQASLLDGGWQLANGAGDVANFYNYDKLFVSYWLLDVVFRVARLFNPTPDVVLLGNIFSCVLLWSAAVAVLMRVRLSYWGVAALIAVVAAPAYVMHAPFLAAVSISAAFLMFLHALLQRAGHIRGLGQALLAALLTFAAVGARADAVLALPFLVWLSLCPMPRPASVFRRPILYLMIGGALAALALGHRMHPEGDIYGITPVFKAKIFAAYIAFGLGGSAFVIALLSVVAGARAYLSKGVWRRWSWIFGILSFFIPFAYYIPQLLSTRYLIVWLAAVFLFVASRRGQALLSLAGHRRVGRWTLGAAVVAAFLPLFLGVNLPFPSRPRIVWRDATLFPSADGLLPMGAYLAFFYAPEGGQPRIPDHSQAVWLAAKSADFQNDTTGAVPILGTPMLEIEKLAAHLKGRKVRVVDESTDNSYADSRSLGKLLGGLETAGKMVDPFGAFVNQVSSQPASPSFRGVAIYRLEHKRTGKDLGRLEGWQILRMAYGGNGFRTFTTEEAVAADGTLRIPLRKGKTVIIGAEEPFGIRTLGVDGMESTVPSHPFGNGQKTELVILDGRQSYVARMQFDPSRPAPLSPIFSEAILPDYMSVQAFNQ